MDLICDLQELVTLTKLYLLQTFSPGERIVSDVPANVAPRPSKTLPPPQPKRPPPPKTSAPKAASPPPRKAVTAATQAPPPPEAPPPPPSRPREPYLQALCRPIERPVAPPLDDIRERLGRLAPGHAFLAAPVLQDAPSWKQHYPACIVVSYLPAPSEVTSFLQQVVQAISERLCPATLYEAPSSPTRLGEIQAEIVAISPSAIIIVGDRGVDFPHFQPLAGKPPRHPFLVQQGTVNGAPLFTLTMTPIEVHDIGFKKQLWHTLQSLLRQ